ncbi:MAG: InlB B-repeat-containing protein, partial [Candidatus Izemoplasmatales bacterium]|nr:InlB B-repeat-containing protein [Candidatus Izemoplasmatales bacterium]
MKKLWQKILAFITNNRILSIMITALVVIIIIVLISLISNCNKNQGQTTMPITTSAITSSTTQSPSISTTFAPTSTSITTSPPLTTIGTTASPITTAATISISFNAYGGSPVSSETIVPGSTILISNKSSTYTNHNFLGWFTAPNGQGTQVNDATIFNTSQTLYAFWELMPRITITYETNGGDAIDPVVFYSNTGENHTINQVPIRSGYSFDGWYDHSGLTGEAVTGTIFISQDTTFYAKWSVDTTHITYEEYYDPYSGIRGYYISEVSDSYSGTELLLPAEIDGNPIIGINASAAESLGIRKATKIIFDEGYEVIGANAFNVWSPQNTLTEVVLPSTMKFIGDNAFYNQNALVNVNISSCENLIGLDNYVFANTALTEVSLPDSVLNLGIGIFEGITPS